MPVRLAITPGEPAGVGPELLVKLAQQDLNAEIVAFADSELLLQRATATGLSLQLIDADLNAAPQYHQAGRLKVVNIPCHTTATAGQLDVANANYVLETLRQATDACIEGRCQGLVTGPVQKSIINDAGIAFSGHTEFLADRCNVDKVVMMLASEQLRVALVTTHLPLSAVPAAIASANLMRVTEILHASLVQQFGCQRPRILVLGLNPHAGEGGHMGSEEIDTIIPCLNTLRARGWQLEGPLPADTAFTPRHLEHCDAVLAMYHDQGLPVLKYQGFGRAVNITLGLPIVRTSVDHGTALDLAGSGRADSGSFSAALNTAITMAEHSRRNRS